MKEYESKVYKRITSLPYSGHNLQRNISFGYRVIKRLLDIVISIIGLTLTFPIFILMGVVCMFGDSKGPIFFKQKRYGKNGRIFTIYKFRSMVVNADQKLKNNHQLYEKYLTNNYKLESSEDPRITKMGLFLRSTSLDELPQLLNVLKGEMSIVGPRPIVEEELKEYKDRVADFLSVKPGLTGFWQVKGRSNIGYPERVNLELYYVYHQSLCLDIGIIFQTFKVVFSKQGAY